MVGRHTSEPPRKQNKIRDLVRAICFHHAANSSRLGLRGYINHSVSRTEFVNANGPGWGVNHAPPGEAGIVDIRVGGHVHDRDNRQPVTARYGNGGSRWRQATEHLVTMVAEGAHELALGVDLDAWILEVVRLLESVCTNEGCEVVNTCGGGGGGLNLDFGR